MFCLPSSSRVVLWSALNSAGLSGRALALAAHPSASIAATSRPISGCVSRPPLVLASHSVAGNSRAFSIQSVRRSPSYQVAELTEHEYAPISDETMHALHDSLEELVEGDAGADGGWEVEYSSGVLTLNLGDSGTYVINKQPPNKQIWLSSPTSGPKRYNWSAERRVWFNARDNGLLLDLLEGELSMIAGRKVTLDVGHP